ncbi:hypothetical protein Tco_0063657 [Tanacetum coccineum]
MSNTTCSYANNKKANEMILQDMIQVSLVEQKSCEEKEARENVALVAEHLASKEIEKLVEEFENVDDSSPTRHDDTSIPGTRIELRSDKESPEVEIVQEKDEETSKDTEVEPNIVIPVNSVVTIARRYLSGLPPLSDISVLAAIYRFLGGDPKL